MLYCFDKKLPFDYSKLEMELSKINGNGILYDGELKAFTDFSGNEFDIKGKVIFPRTGVVQIYEMNDEIIKQGGLPIISNEQVDIIEDWPKYCVTDRKLKVLSGNDLINPEIISELESIYGNEIFIKTKNKNFNSVIPIKLLRDTECSFYKALTYHLEEDFIVSERVDIEEDEYGKKEYRCFVVNNQVYNISRFTVDVFHKIDDKVLEKAEEIVRSLTGKFPNCYVLDLFEYKIDNVSYVDVLEINPIHSSGLYLYNSAMEKSENLLHSELKKVSHEFLGRIDRCSLEGEFINNRDSLYNISGSFAGDLRSICLTGSIGLVFSTYTNLTVDDFARHNEVYDFEEMKPLCDEDFLMSDEEIFEDCIPDDDVNQGLKLIKQDKDN